MVVIFLLGLIGSTVQPIVFRAILVSPWLHAVPFLLVEPSPFFVDELMSPLFGQCQNFVASILNFSWLNPSLVMFKKFFLAG